jgi:two-component sensor histidine kinase
MTLHAFLEALFQPYADNAGNPRVIVTGDDALFDDQAATSVALLFHELATNAAKYGALSVVGGGVTLETRTVGDRFRLTWTERGGPAIESAPTRSGFGSSLATVSVEGQLAGKLERIWKTRGFGRSGGPPRNRAFQTQGRPERRAGLRWCETCKDVVRSGAGRRSSKLKE